MVVDKGIGDELAGASDKSKEGQTTQSFENTTFNLYLERPESGGEERNGEI